MSPFYYYLPRIENVSVERDGSNVRIAAMRNYCRFYSEDGVTDIENFCEVRYRYRQLPDGTLSAWTTILDANNLTTNKVATLEELGLSEDESYEFVVGVVDSLQYESNTRIVITAAGVFMDRDGELNAISIGEAVSNDSPNTVTVAEKMTLRAKGTARAKNVEVDNSVRLGGTVIYEHRLQMYDGGLNKYHRGEINASIPSHSDYLEPTVAEISHKSAGSIKATCDPEDYVVKVELQDEVGATRLAMETTEERVLITGLTEPVDDADAVNKAYADTKFVKNSDTIPVTQGGTGATSADSARKNLGLNIPTYNTFAQLGLTASCTTAEVFAAMPSPSIFIINHSKGDTIKITDTPHDWCMVEIFKCGLFGSCYAINVNVTSATPYEGSLFFNSSNSTVKFSGWKQSNVTYSLSKDGSTISLTGSDGSESSVEDTSGSGTSTTSGMIREFNTGAISDTSYTTTGYTKSKFYNIVVATSANAGTLSTHTIDWQQILAMAGSKDTEIGFILTLSTSVQAVLYCKINSNNTATFRITGTTSPVIRSVCGYY